jgi:hypothetical protein
MKERLKGNRRTIKGYSKRRRGDVREGRWIKNDKRKTKREDEEKEEVQRKGRLGT